MVSSALLHEFILFTDLSKLINQILKHQNKNGMCEPVNSAVFMDIHVLFNLPG